MRIISFRAASPHRHPRVIPRPKAVGISCRIAAKPDDQNSSKVFDVNWTNNIHISVLEIATSLRSSQ